MTDDKPDTVGGSDNDREKRDFVDHLMGSRPLRAEDTLTVPEDEHVREATDQDVPSDSKALSELLDESDKETIDRADVIGEGARWFAAWCLRFLIVAAALTVAWMALSKVWAGVLPVLLALMLSTVLWPVSRTLRRVRYVPNALAAVIALVGSILLVGGVLALMTPVVQSQLPSLVRQFNQGVEHLQQILMKPPFNVDNQQVSEVMDKATAWLQERSGTIAGTVFQGLSAVSSVAVTLVVTLVLTFFFIKDGDRFLPWVRKITGRRLGWHLTEVLTRSWNTLSGFIRAQALVSLIDGIFIGLGLWIMNVPLALVLAVLTFFAGFIPIVGAFTAGFVAVVVALVANGPTTAIATLALIIAVQQIEGNILSPMLQSKAMELHAAIVLLSITVGGGLFGIVGAFLAVPVAAMIAVWFRYLGDITDLRTGDKTARDIEFATEAGSISGMQAEAVGRAMRDRLSGRRPEDNSNADDRTEAAAEDVTSPAEEPTEAEQDSKSRHSLSDVMRLPFRHKE
ncbi:AI-2E family transporter [Corynebacterium sp. TAE3-ERU12]|uniref:AI-2E family transporter n=1 Tax=Corynebacterium sp. TAE3-ERU12 TaxID=2849491 RepID=UPI001C43D0B2|nr:AI-2E family transporter [Corynebacterium sp. TAE3-ERU12]MBV7295721.1 AI-2E family transporter [Corynebacterium sp. TAE3-ERU12]